MQATAVTVPLRTLEVRATALPVRVVEAFLLRIDSPNTCRAYARAIGATLRRISRPSIAEVTAADLAAVRALIVADGRSPATHAQELAALRSFFLWSRKEHVAVSPLSKEAVEDALRMPRATVRKPYQIPTEPELTAILRAAEDPRDRALLSVLADAGLRVSEAVGLDVGDVHERPEGGALLHVRGGKGQKDRHVPGAVSVLTPILRYLEETGRTLQDPGPLFRARDRAAASRGRQRLTACGARGIVSKVTHRAGVKGKKLTPHSFRHGFAVRALRHGAKVPDLARILGHSNIETTMRYVDHSNFGDLLAAVPELPTA